MVDRSEVENFFKRLSNLQKIKPCYEAIDMRKRVAEPCNRYIFNDRLHYLDDRSLQIYQEGLKKRHGVLTMEIFDAVTTGPHTLGASHQPDHLTFNTSVVSQGIVEDENPLVDADSQTSVPDNIHFGYFKERREPRLQFVCEVEVMVRGVRMRGVLRDISVGGAQLLVDGAAVVNAGDEVDVSFMGLQNEASGVDVYGIPYQVVGSEISDTETLLRLGVINGRQQSSFVNFISTLVARKDPNRRLDIEDDCQTVLSWYYERLYADNSTAIPFFVGQKENEGLCVQSVALTKGNRHLAKFFCTYADNYNFTPLCIPKRLQRLQQGESILVAMYREQGEKDRTLRIHSASDLDYSCYEEFIEYMREALSHAEHCVVKLTPGFVPARQVSQKKIDLITNRLRETSAQKADELISQLEVLQFIGYMSDMTVYASHLCEQAEKGSPVDSTLLAWVGTELRNLGTGDVQEKIELSVQALKPEITRFGYVERRREHRYLARTAIELQIREQRYKGMSVDLSRHGLRIAIPEKIAVKQGAMVKVSLLTMQQKRESLDLMNVPYRVVNYFHNEHTVLMLERLVGNKDSVLDDFFEELIKRNRDKLQVDTGDVLSATAARAFETLVAVNTQSIAFFLGRDKVKGAYLQYVGIPSGGNPLSDYCNHENIGHFGHLFNQKIVKALYDAVSLLVRRDQLANSSQTSFEFDLYLYRSEVQGSSDVSFLVATEFDVEGEEEWKTLLETVRSTAEWRALRVVATTVNLVQDKLFDTLLDKVRSESKHRAIQISDAVSSVVGCGEIFDITAEMSLID